MTFVWQGDPPPEEKKLSFLNWALVVLRGPALAILVFGCLAVHLMFRIIEFPLFGSRRPLTPKITKFVCQNALRILQIRLVVHGAPMEGVGAAVANHSSWLDIFALNAQNEIYFVAKSEVSTWPAIGWLARATGTMFVVRDRKRAVEQTREMQNRLSLGHRLLFFPEGTSTDGQRVLPFKPTLFQSFFEQHGKSEISIQPVTVKYVAPQNEDPRFYGWWGDKGFGENLLKILATPKPGRIELFYHQPCMVGEYENRKNLAAHLREQVASQIEKA